MGQVPEGITHHWMTRVLISTFFVVVTGGKSDKSKAVSECTPAETRYGKCVPESGDCGEGLREATCKDRTDKIHCKIPCNWKKDISESLDLSFILSQHEEVLYWGGTDVRIEFEALQDREFFCYH